MYFRQRYPANKEGTLHSVLYLHVITDRGAELAGHIDIRYTVVNSKDIGTELAGHIDTTTRYSGEQGHGMGTELAGR
jgi:hypothetical protein